MIFIKLTNMLMFEIERSEIKEYKKSRILIIWKINLNSKTLRTHSGSAKWSEHWSLRKYLNVWLLDQLV